MIDEKQIRQEITLEVQEPDLNEILLADALNRQISTITSKKSHCVPRGSSYHREGNSFAPEHLKKPNKMGGRGGRKYPQPGNKITYKA